MRSPAPRDTTRRPYSGVRSWGWAQSTEENSNIDYSTSQETFIIRHSLGCIATAAVWRDCPALYRKSAGCCTTRYYGKSSSNRRLLVDTPTSLKSPRLRGEIIFRGHWRALSEKKKTPLAVPVPATSSAPKQRGHYRESWTQHLVQAADHLHFRELRGIPPPAALTCSPEDAIDKSHSDYTPWKFS
jgi:hypothetical protein